MTNIVRDNGTNAFAPGPDRIELLYKYTAGDSDEAHAAPDYPTPDSVTGQAGAGDLDPLRATLAALPDPAPKIQRDATTSHLLSVGADWRFYNVPQQPYPEMAAALRALEALAETLEPS